MIVILLLFGLLFYVAHFIENMPQRYFSIFFALALYVALLYVFLNFRYTADWDMYYYFYKHEEDGTDWLFVFLTKIFKSLKLPYVNLYQFHIVVSLSLLFLWVKQFTRNVFFVILFYLILDNLHFVNQLRYYLGFGMYLFGLFFLFEKKNYLAAIPFLIVALLSHSGLVVLLIFVPVYYFVPAKKFQYWLLGLAALMFGITVYIYNSGLGDILVHFGSYLAKDNVSSILGGLFNAVPYILIMGFLYVETLRLQLIEPEIVDRKHFKFLQKLSFFPVIFIPASILIQIIGHRYVMPFSLVWLTYYYVFFIHERDGRTKLLRFSMVIGVGILCALSIYVLPDYVVKENYFWTELELMLKSHPQLKKLVY